jgi:hypothetical protein
LGVLDAAVHRASDAVATINALPLATQIVDTALLAVAVKRVVTIRVFFACRWNEIWRLIGLASHAPVHPACPRVRIFVLAAAVIFIAAGDECARGEQRERRAEKKTKFRKVHCVTPKWRRGFDHPGLFAFT